MVDLSLHLLDIVENSIAAGARTIRVAVRNVPGEDLLELAVIDDGKGMTPEMVSRVKDPFVTTRVTRRVGLGIPLLEQVAVQSGGGLTIESEPSKGTRLCAWFRQDSIDLPPVGDMPQTLSVLIGTNPELRFILSYTGRSQFVFDSKSIAVQFLPVPLTEPTVLLWLREHISEGISRARGGEPV